MNGCALLLVKETREVEKTKWILDINGEKIELHIDKLYHCDFRFTRPSVFILPRLAYIVCVCVCVYCLHVSSDYWKLNRLVLPYPWTWHGCSAHTCLTCEWRNQCIHLITRLPTRLHLKFSSNNIEVLTTRSCVCIDAFTRYERQNRIIIHADAKHDHLQNSNGTWFIL